MHTFSHETWIHPVTPLDGVRVEAAAITTAGSLGGRPAFPEEKNEVLHLGKIA